MRLLSVSDSRFERALESERAGRKPLPKRRSIDRRGRLGMEVRARAPGKIILCGEHAVVHGSAAVAAAIDLHTHASLRLFPSGGDDDGGLLELELKDLNLVLSWPCSRLKDAIGEIAPPVAAEPRSCASELLELFAGLIEEKNLPESRVQLGSGLSAFLFLYTAIHGFRSGKVVVTSNIPIGSGLGSSAAFCVALAAALIALSDAVCIDNQQVGWLTYSNSELELVNRWAFEGEKVIHGKPSGIDNTVSTFGSMIKFKKGELTKIQSSTPLRMLITDTKVGRNTKALVASVSERASRHPDAMGAVFTTVDCISQELAAIVEAPALDDLLTTTKEEKLEELIEMNQGLLQCMGVSHASIETVLQTTLKYKLASKLTGAGGGGCVLTLIPTLLSSTVMDKVIAELESCGFRCFRVEVGGKGVEVCYS